MVGSLNAATMTSSSPSVASTTSCTPERSNSSNATTARKPTVYLRSTHCQRKQPVGFSASADAWAGVSVGRNRGRTASNRVFVVSGTVVPPAVLSWRLYEAMIRHQRGAFGRTWHGISQAPSRTDGTGPKQPDTSGRAQPVPGNARQARWYRGGSVSPVVLVAMSTSQSRRIW